MCEGPLTVDQVTTDMLPVRLTRADAWLFEPQLKPVDLPVVPGMLAAADASHVSIKVLVGFARCTASSTA
jgi:hypothetical protein